MDAEAKNETAAKGARGLTLLVLAAYVLFIVAHRLALAPAVAIALEETKGLPLLTHPVTQSGCYADFPLLPRAILAAALEPWVLLALAPLMLLHIGLLRRGRLGERSALVGLLVVLGFLGVVGVSVCVTVRHIQVL